MRPGCSEEKYGASTPTFPKNRRAGGRTNPRNFVNTEHREGRGSETGKRVGGRLALVNWPRERDEARSVGEHTLEVC